MLDIICHSYMNNSYKLILLFFAEVKTYEGKLSDVGRKVGMCQETVSKGCKFLRDEGFIDLEITNGPRASLFVEYLGK